MADLRFESPSPIFFFFIGNVTVDKRAAAVRACAVWISSALGLGAKKGNFAFDDQFYTTRRRRRHGEETEEEEEEV